MVFDLGGVGRISAPQSQSVSGERLIGNHFHFIGLGDSSGLTVQGFDRNLYLLRPTEILVASR